MNQARITYRDFENAGQLARITELMEGLRPLFPEWPESIDVERIDKFDDSDQSTMSININPDYLNFRIEVYNCFWQVPEEKQRRKVIHEIVHALHADVIMFNRDRMVDYIKAQNPDLGAYLGQEHTARVERFTQTMAFAIERMLVATEAKTVIQTPEAVKGIREMAEGLMAARDAIGDGKPYTISACAKCGGGQGSDLRTGSHPSILYCGPCWDALYQHGNGAEPAKPYTGVSTIARPEKHVCTFCENSRFGSEPIQVSPDQWAHPKCLENHRKQTP